MLGFAQYDVKWQISGLAAVEYLKRRARSQTKPKILWRTQNNNYNMTAWLTIWTELIFKYSLHAIYTCCLHLSILTSTILAVLFVSPSKIALEKFYVYCPPLLLDEIYAPGWRGKNYSPSPHWTRREKYMHFNGLHRLMKSFCFALNYFVLK